MQYLLDTLKRPINFVYKKTSYKCHGNILNINTGIFQNLWKERIITKRKITNLSAIGSYHVLS